MARRLTATLLMLGALAISSPLLAHHGNAAFAGQADNIKGREGDEFLLVATRIA